MNVRSTTNYSAFNAGEVQRCQWASNRTNESVTNVAFSGRDKAVRSLVCIWLPFSSTEALGIKGISSQLPISL